MYSVIVSRVDSVGPPQQLCSMNDGVVCGDQWRHNCAVRRLRCTAQRPGTSVTQKQYGPRTRTTSDNTVHTHHLLHLLPSLPWAGRPSL